MANVCTAGSNLVLLNLAPLNSPLLRQGQDEATGSAVLEQPQFVFPSAVSWDSSGTTVQGDKALVHQDLREPLSPNGPAWPRTLQKPGPGIAQGAWAPSLWYWLRCPLYI